MYQNMETHTNFTQQKKINFEKKETKNPPSGIREGNGSLFGLGFSVTAIEKTNKQRH
jgi:hypothetical protein